MSFPDRRFSIFLVLGVWLTIALLATATAHAAEALKLELEFFAEGDPLAMNRATVWISGRRLRVEQRTPGHIVAGPVLVYRGDQDVIFSISEPHRSYARIGRTMLSLLGTESRRARQEIEAQLQRLPADQRKGFERLVGVARADPANLDRPVIVTRVDERATVAGFECTRMLISRGDRSLGEACVASWESVGMTRADAEVFRMLGNFQRDAIAPRGPTPLELVPNQPLELLSQFDGLPLSFERRVGKQERSAIRVTEIERVTPDDSLFEAPLGYALRPGPRGFLEHMASAGTVGAPSPPPARRGDPGTTPTTPKRPEAASSRRRPAPRYRSIRLFPDGD